MCMQPVAIDPFTACCSIGTKLLGGQTSTSEPEFGFIAELSAPLTPLIPRHTRTRNISCRPVTRTLFPTRLRADGCVRLYNACLRVCVYACLRVCVFACLRVCVYACARMGVRAHACGAALSVMHPYRRPPSSAVCRCQRHAAAISWRTVTHAFQKLRL